MIAPSDATADEDAALCACWASRKLKYPKINRAENVCHRGAINDWRAGTAPGVIASAGMRFRKLTQVGKPVGRIANNIF
jgi:hypothetical protein